MYTASVLLGCSCFSLFLANLLAIVVITVASEYGSCDFNTTAYIIANMLAIDFTAIYMATTDKFTSPRARMVDHITYILAMAFQTSAFIVDIVKLNTDCIAEIRQNDAVFVTLLAFPCMHGISVVFLACVYPIIMREFWQNLKRTILDYNGN